MENKNSNVSIFFKEMGQCVLLLIYILSLNFITKPIYLVIPVVLGIMVINLSLASMKQQYQVLGIKNDEEEEKACTWSALSELFILLTIDFLAVGNAVGIILGIVFFIIHISYSKKSYKYITEFLIKKYKEQNNNKDEK